jgi:hypothetical protein
MNLSSGLVSVICIMFNDELPFLAAAVVSNVPEPLNWQFV